MQKRASNLAGMPTIFGVDFYSTATGWYNTQPDVFADAQALPFHSNSIDHCLLLEGIEMFRARTAFLCNMQARLEKSATLDDILGRWQIIAEPQRDLNGMTSWLS